MLAARALPIPATNAQPDPGAPPQLAPGQGPGLALGMPTVPTLRDVGACETSDGMTLARGIACGSDTFNPMSAEDLKKLGQFALKNDYDLRTTAGVEAMRDETPPGVRSE